MNIIDTPLAGVKIIEPQVWADGRGYFFESFRASVWRDNGIAVNFIQDNESLSQYGVVRGMHFQSGAHAQAKLVRVICGKVWDVVVDIRRGSPTFGQFFGAELSGRNHRMLFIPRGFAHGFAVLEDDTVFTYKCDNEYCPAAERGFAWNDAAVNIPWPVPAEKVILSAKDANRITLADCPDLFDYAGVAPAES